MKKQVKTEIATNKNRIINDPSIKIVKKSDAESLSSSLLLTREKKSHFVEAVKMRKLKSLSIFCKSIFYHYFPFIMKKIDVDFVFLVHVRYLEDYSYGLSFLNFLKVILPVKLYRYLLGSIPPLIIDEITSDQKVSGLIITTTKTAPFLLTKRSRVKKELRHIRRLIGNVQRESKRKTVIGLGGWWPIVTLNGKTVNEFFSEDSFVVTTGHSNTVLSITKMVESICDQSRINDTRIRIVIIGVGNIGEAISELLIKKYDKFVLIDINKKKLENAKNRLEQKYQGKQIDIALIQEIDVKKILMGCHIGICATSSVSNVINAEDIPDNFIFFDDSRPEAIPRFGPDENRYVIEGGLFKIEGIKTSYNFGFGNDGNIWGCFAETFLLALAQRKNVFLKNTIGNIDYRVLESYDSFRVKNNIRIGDFLTGERKVKKSVLVQALKKRDKLVSNAY